MGIYDRDYFQDGFESAPPTGQKWVLPPISKTVLYVILFNISLFLITGLARTWFPDTIGIFIYKYFYLQPIGSGFYPWQLFSWAILHASIGHVLGNMFSFYIFASDIEKIYPGKKFIYLYIGSALFAGLVISIANLIMSEPLPTLGASGMCFTVMALYLIYFPNRMFLFNIPAWLIIIVIFGINIFAALESIGPAVFPSQVSISGHLGGAAFGFLWFKYYDKVSNIGNQMQAKKIQKIKDADINLRQELDRILAKINAEGMISLNKKEKDILKQASDKFKSEM